MLINYDTNAKVAPPLRKIKDSNALINGLRDGIIDCIATDHAPHTIEEKEKDIIHAPCGMISLESAFGLSHKILKQNKIPSERVIEFFTLGPAKVMQWDIDPFALNQKANFVILDLEKKWNFSKQDIYSKSKNSPIIGMDLLGRVDMTICGDNAFGFLSNVT